MFLSKSLQTLPKQLQRSFAKSSLSTFQLTGYGEPPGGVTWKLKEETKEQKIEHELETFLAALAGCENYTATYHAKKNGIDYKGISFKIEADYDFRTHLEGEKIPNRFSQIRVEAEVETDDSQEKVDKLKDLVKQFCPVYNMLKLSGIDMKSDWKKKEVKADEEETESK